MVEIFNNLGQSVGRYRYDAWGACTVTHATLISLINPFRYRGYYYDTESGLYYLQSRYYDPNTGRFINGDQAVISVVSGAKSGHNSFAYCCNDPIGRADPTGFVSYSNTVIKTSAIRWDIKTVITIGKTNFTYLYHISNGMVRFYFQKTIIGVWFGAVHQRYWLQQCIKLSNLLTELT